MDLIAKHIEAIGTALSKILRALPVQKLSGKQTLNFLIDFVALVLGVVVLYGQKAPIRLTVFVGVLAFAVWCFYVCHKSRRATETTATRQQPIVGAQPEEVE